MRLVLEKVTISQKSNYKCLWCYWQRGGSMLFLGTQEISMVILQNTKTGNFIGINNSSFKYRPKRDQDTILQ